jgi:hypothetical protein
VPDTRQHRGPHPEDDGLFAPETLPALHTAADDLCWLLDRGYASVSALKLVGDRYELKQRQRIAVGRCTCSRAAADIRRRRQIEPENLKGEELWLDGYNVITTLEAALAGGVVLVGRDGCYRDMASMHGSYRKVAETLPALRLVGEVTSPWPVSRLRWYLDSPVSNSGRLKRILLDVAAAAGWNWDVELARDPDAVLTSTEQIVVSADSAILDRCGRWLNLARIIISAQVPGARLVDLSGNRTDA